MSSCKSDQGTQIVIHYYYYFSKDVFLAKYSIVWRARFINFKIAWQTLVFAERRETLQIYFCFLPNDRTKNNEEEEEGTLVRSFVRSFVRSLTVFFGAWYRHLHLQVILMQQDQFLVLASQNALFRTFWMDNKFEKMNERNKYVGFWIDSIWNVFPTILMRKFVWKTIVNTNNNKNY
jgi:hypothetical protein